MKQSFTLVEVLISIFIITLLIGALLQNSESSTTFLLKIEKKSYIEDYLTIVANHPNSNFNHLQKSLYTFVEGDYLIDDLEFKKLLKNKKLLYREQEESLFPEKDKNIKLESNDLNNSNDNLGIKLKKLTIFDNKEREGSYIYLVQPIQ